MNYYPIAMAGITLGIYWISYLFTRKTLITGKKKYLFSTHRKVWNIILLLLFLAFAPVGFLMAINEVYYIGLETGGLLEWHVNVGSAFLVVGIFHALWHLSYFRKGIKKLIQRP